MISAPEASPLNPSMMLIALATPPMENAVKASATRRSRAASRSGQLDPVHDITRRQREQEPGAHRRDQPPAHADLARQILDQPGDQRRQGGDPDGEHTPRRSAGKTGVTTA